MAAVLAATFTAGAPTISTLLQARAGFSLAGVFWQPEDVGPQPDKGEPPAPGDGSAPAKPSASADQREARVLMSNGSILTGLLVEHSKDVVVLKINGIPTPIPVKDIARIDTLLPNQERYDQYRAALDAKDARSRLNLAKWLQSVDMFTEALHEAKEVLKIEPEDPQAKDLVVQLEEQLRLRSSGGKPAKEEAAKPQEVKAKLPPFPGLTTEQINLIRVYEVNLADPPRMAVSRDTITKLLEQFAGDPLVPVSKEGRDALYRKRPEQILELMFKLRARDFYSMVKVQQDPESMHKFRESVHRGWLVNYCATTECHGGTDAGRLWLNSRLPNTDATVYTNFLILDRMKTRATKGDRKGDLVPLIDYANPGQSPLLQLALPPEESLFPHPTPNRPGKQAFRPLFRSEEDARFQRAVEWIQSMYLPRPDYGINFAPPTPPQAPVAQQPPGAKPDEPAPPPNPER